MARTARQKAKSNTYHIMLRGVNRQSIFEDDEDNLRFLKILSECKEVSGFSLYAYCLMWNHVHLLIQVLDEPIETVMRRITTRYAVWFNKKHERVGHLFQNRYRSEPVDDEAYLFTAVRYILYNPVKAGYCDNIYDYAYSSANDYLYQNGMTDTSFIMGLRGRERLLEYLKIPADESGLLAESQKESTECERQSCVGMNHSQILEKIPEYRKAGFTLKQISEITHLSPATIKRYSYK